MLTPIDDSRTYEAFLLKVPPAPDASVERRNPQRGLASLGLPSSLITLLAIVVHWQRFSSFD